MGVFAHATHLYLPDKEHGRLLVGSMLKSPHSLVISTPYDTWINVYLEMGLSYKDVPEFPTSTTIELNCYDSEGLDVRMYAQDRLAFLFESGCSEVAEQEDQLLEIAAKIWKDDPDRIQPEPMRTPLPDEEDSEDGGNTKPQSREADFWDLAPSDQEKYVQQARGSGEFKKFVTDSTQADDIVPDPAIFEPYLPKERSIDDFHVLLNATSRRLHGAPTDEKQKTILERWMGGKTHSVRSEDYVEAIGSFLGVRGCLWSLESIQQHLGDKIDRRIVNIQHLTERPPNAK